MAKTVDVARDRAYDDTKTVMPGEVARGVYLERAPSAQGLKLLLLLLGTAGGAMGEEKQHEIRLADLKRIEGVQNHSRETLRALFVELRGAVLVYEETDSQDEIIGGFIDELRVGGQSDDTGELYIKWWFGRTFRRIASESNHWAIIDRQTVYALRSKFSILLFQHVSSLVNLHHITSKTFTVDEIRAVLGVEGTKLTRFADLRRFAIEPAIEEISQLSRFTVTASPEKVGRSVRRVTISWQLKDDLRTTRRELDQPKVGRKARRDQTVETITDRAGPAFPASGGIAFDTFWHGIKVQSGCNMDSTMVAEKFRAFCEQRKIALTSPKIADVFKSFCGKIGKV